MKFNLVCIPAFFAGLFIGILCGVQIEEESNNSNLVFLRMARYEADTGKLSKAFVCKRAIYALKSDKFEEVGE